MTAATQTRTKTHRERGNTAYAIVDSYRTEFDDHFDVVPLETEFPRLQQRLGSSGVFLARAGDNLAGAFKWRGALVGAKALQENGADSLIVPSAGNHARGAVLAAKWLDMSLHVVVPETAPPAKKEGLRELWDDPKFQLHTVGASFDESLAWALDHSEYGALLHPYDNPYVAAGQGTLADDIVAQLPDVKRIVMPVGGGGLLAGIRERLDQLGYSHVVTHAVEAEGSDSFSRSLEGGTREAAERPNSRYGGSAVHMIGKHTLAVCQRSRTSTEWSMAPEAKVDAVTEEYLQDRHELFNPRMPSYEPTTLVAIAGLEQVAQRYPDGPTVVVGTGHNASHQAHNDSQQK